MGGGVAKCNERHSMDKETAENRVNLWRMAFVDASNDEPTVSDGQINHA